MALKVHLVQRAIKVSPAILVPTQLFRVPKDLRVTKETEVTKAQPVLTQQ